MSQEVQLVRWSVGWKQRNRQKLRQQSLIVLKDCCLLWWSRSWKDTDVWFYSILCSHLHLVRIRIHQCSSFMEVYIGSWIVHRGFLLSKMNEHWIKQFLIKNQRYANTVWGVAENRTAANICSVCFSENLKSRCLMTENLHPIKLYSKKTTTKINLKSES